MSPPTRHQGHNDQKFYPTPVSLDHPLPGAVTLPDGIYTNDPSTTSVPSPVIFLLHPTLAYQPPLQPQTVLGYDVRKPLPRPPRTVEANLPDLMIPATSPPTLCLRLISPSLPWTIDILNPSAAGPITVLQVFDAIHASLQVPITTSELASASTNRISRMRGTNGGGGDNFRRVDWLLNKTTFLGLRKDDDEIANILGLGVDQYQLAYTMILMLK